MPTYLNTTTYLLPTTYAHILHTQIMEGRIPLTTFSNKEQGFRFMSLKPIHMIGIALLMFVSIPFLLLLTPFGAVHNDRPQALKSFTNKDTK